MAMQQHYYTSCAHGTTGQSGFQAKARSAGIPAPVEKTVLSMAGYRIPPSLDVRDIVRHPVALRYDYLGPNRCVLTCSQSNGQDEKGRNGNFFAHSVITSPQDFSVFPPIMFWRHPFWKTSDPSDALEIPEEEAFDLEPSLELDNVWPFLDQPERRGWFRKLLAATLQFPDTKRPVVILDDTDNVALWIAAVTFALPPSLRPTLTFATYHHDPYSAAYCIIGTTRAGDSTFRFTPDEYISHFVLNAFDNRISAIEDSAYAEYVCDHFFPEPYEDKLLDFFLACNRRLPPRPRNAARHLDDITRFALAVREGTVPLSDAVGQRAVATFITDMEARESLADDELRDLQRTATRLLAEIRRSGSDALPADYGRALALLKRHDADFPARMGEELALLADAVFANRSQQAAELIPLIDRLYAREAILRAVAAPEYLGRLTASLPGNNLTVPALFWKTLSRYVVPAPNTFDALAALVQRSMQAIEASAGANPPDIPLAGAQALMNAMLAANPGMDKVAGDALASATRLTVAPYWLYYALVGAKPLAERQTLRHRFAPGAAHAIDYEMRRDLLAAPLSNVGALLRAWCDHLAQYPELQGRALTQGADLALSAYTGLQKSQIVHQLLADDEVAQRLDRALTAKLLTSFFTGLTLQTLTPPQVALYEKYVDFEGLSADQRALMKGCLAVTTQKIDQSALAATQARLQRADPATYQLEAAKWMDRFFERKVTFEEHLKMLQAIYAPRHSECFWALYWERLNRVALDRTRTGDFITMLNFWFDQGLTEFISQPFLAQEFFMGLPQAFEELRSEKGYGAVSRAIEDQAAKQPWFPSLYPHLAETKKKGLLGLLKR